MSPLHAKFVVARVHHLALVAVFLAVGGLGAAHAATATATTLSSSANPMLIGTATTLTATVSPATAFGRVTFKDGAAVLGTADAVGGVATLNASLNIMSGNRSITAVFAGNTTYSASTSAPVLQVVEPVGGNWGQIAAQNTSFTLAAPDVVRFGEGANWVQKYFVGAATCSAAFFGSDPSPGVTKRCEVRAPNLVNLTFESSVNPVPVGSGTVLKITLSPVSASGTVTFRDGATVLTTVSVVSGVASATRSFTTAGMHALTATYSGSVVHAGTSVALAQSVTPRSTGLSLTSSINPSAPGQTTALVARLNVTSATGTVTFLNGAVTLGAAPVGGGAATLQQAFDAGTHNLTAIYSGDANHLGSTSAILRQTASSAVALPAVPISPRPITQFEYDAEGRRAKTIAAPGVAGFNLADVTAHDALGRPALHTNSAGASTGVAYDGMDRPVQVTDPRNLATATPRNGFGDVVRLQSPDTGVSTHTYDVAGRLQSQTDSRGVVATRLHDELGRTTRLAYSLGGQSLTYAWNFDETGPGFANGIGRLTSTTFPGGGSRYLYDVQGRLTQDVHRIDPVAGANAAALNLTTVYDRDLGGRINRIVYPSGRTLRIAFADGLPSAITLARDNAALPATVIDQIRYTAVGPVADWRLALPIGADTHERRFDESARVVRQTLGRFVRDLRYDAADRITGYIHYDRATGTATTAANALNQTFGYDAAGRLTSVVMGASTWSIGYDASGNRTGVTLNGVARAYTTEATSNRLSSVANPLRSFGYDAAGNTTGDSTGSTSTYNLAGRMDSVTKGTTTTRYLYDTDGRRVRKHASSGSSSTVVFVYDLAGHLLGEYDRNGLALREFVWLGDIPVAMFTPGATAADPPVIYWIHPDHLGTPRVVVDANNALRWTWYAEPFGTSAPNANPQGLGSIVFNLRLPGQYADSESGLFYNYFRDYDATVGRYTQSDPIGLAGGINTYAYVGGNPVSFVDPMGLDPFDVQFNRGAGTIWITPPGSTSAQGFAAANNATSTSRGAWAPGTYSFDYSTTHRDDAPGSSYGSNGNAVFKVPGCVGCGVHSGREGKRDLRDRWGVQHATEGCIRTTDDATKLLQDLIRQGHTPTLIVLP